MENSCWLNLLELKNLVFKIAEYRKTQSVNNYGKLINPAFTKIFNEILKENTFLNNFDNYFLSLIQLEDNDENIVIAILQSLNKILFGKLKIKLIVDNMADEKNCKWINANFLNIFIDEISKIKVSNANIEIFAMKKINFIKFCFDISFDFLNLLLVNKLFTVLKQFETGNYSLQIKEFSRESFQNILKIISSKILCKNFNDEEEKVILFFIKELLKEISGYIDIYKKESNPNKNFENMKVIEQIFMNILFVFNKIYQYNQIKKFQEFINKDLIYIFIQLSQIDNSTLSNASVMAFEIYLTLFNKNLIDDVLEFSILFGHLIFNKLNQVKNKIKENINIELIDLGEFKNILLFLEKFFLNKDNLLIMIAKNDFHILKRSLFEEIMNLLFEIMKLSKNYSGKEELKSIFSLITKTIINFVEVNILNEDTKLSQKEKDELQNIKAIKEKWRNLYELFNSNLLEDEKAMNLAIILKIGQGINSAKLMEILSNPDRFCILVLEKYISSFNFEGISLVFAMRILFCNFLMFGESQMIERVLEAFSYHYFNSNQDTIFKSTTGMYTFIYALIMLNTDLHNSTIEPNKKMKIEEFINNCRKINDGENLPESMLREAYSDIQQNEIKIMKERDMFCEENLLKEIWDYYYKNKKSYEDYYQISRFEKHLKFETENVKLDAISYMYEIICNRINENIDCITYKLKDSQDIQIFFETYINLCINNDSLNILISLIVKIILNSIEKFIYTIRIEQTY